MSSSTRTRPARYAILYTVSWFESAPDQLVLLCIFGFPKDTILSIHMCEKLEDTNENVQAFFFLPPQASALSLHVNTKDA